MHIFGSCAFGELVGYYYGRLGVGIYGLWAVKDHPVVFPEFFIGSISGILYIKTERMELPPK
jgi:hypothetical protein